MKSNDQLSFHKPQMAMHVNAIIYILVYVFKHSLFSFKTQKTFVTCHNADAQSLNSTQHTIGKYVKLVK
jgi:hypothetical protein